VKCLSNSFARAFNQDTRSWDVSSVTDMGAMFYSATTFNQNIGSWDVSKVTNMNHMLYRVIFMFHIVAWFNRDVRSWDLSNVTDMSGKKRWVLGCIKCDGHESHVCSGIYFIPMHWSMGCVRCDWHA
jgi:surface protein